MKYIIEVDEQLNNILTKNANANGISVPTLVSQLLKRYVVDAHIMEQTDLWQNGIAECAEINLDWANL